MARTSAPRKGAIGEKKVPLAVTTSNHYTYDGSSAEEHRLKNFDRGDLNGTYTGISGTPVREYDWDLDPTGNWETLLKKTSGTTDFDQDRTHNEVTGITATMGTDWADSVHDRNGNMTTVPQPLDLANSYTAEYDAWNRLVEVLDGQTSVGAYEYDGLPPPDLQGRERDRAALLLLQTLSGPRGAA